MLGKGEQQQKQVVGRRCPLDRTRPVSVTRTLSLHPIQTNKVPDRHARCREGTASHCTEGHPHSMQRLLYRWTLKFFVKSIATMGAAIRHRARD